MAAEPPPEEGALVKALLDSLHDRLVMLDTDGVITHVSPSMCAMTGFAAEELVGAGTPRPYRTDDKIGQLSEAFDTYLGVGTASTSAR